MPEHGYTEREPHEPNFSPVPRNELEWMLEYHTKVLKNPHGYETAGTLEHSHTFLRYYERELDRRCHDCGKPLVPNQHDDHVCDNKHCFLYKG